MDSNLSTVVDNLKTDSSTPLLWCCTLLCMLKHVKLNRNTRRRSAI
jgi:hypothetical protein